MALDVIRRRPLGLALGSGLHAIEVDPKLVCTFCKAELGLAVSGLIYFSDLA